MAFSWKINFQYHQNVRHCHWKSFNMFSLPFIFLTLWQCFWKFLKIIFSKSQKHMETLVRHDQKKKKSWAKSQITLGQKWISQPAKCAGPSFELFFHQHTDSSHSSSSQQKFWENAEKCKKIITFFIILRMRTRNPFIQKKKKNLKKFWNYFICIFLRFLFDAASCLSVWSECLEQYNCWATSSSLTHYRTDWLFLHWRNFSISVNWEQIFIPFSFEFLWI